MTTLDLGGKIIRNIALAIFDKDGTLIDVHTYWANMIKFRAEMLQHRLGLSDVDRDGLIDAMGVDLGSMQIKPEGPVGLKKREIVRQYGVDFLKVKGYPALTTLFDDVFQTVDLKSLDHFSEIVRPVNGLFTLVNQLKKAGCAIAVATTDRTERARLAMEYLGIDGAIDFILGADMVKRPKPDPESIQIICESLGIPAEKSVMVGDSASDVKTGLNAGCAAAIGVSSGLTPVKTLAALTPYWVEDISCIQISVEPNRV